MQLIFEDVWIISLTFLAPGPFKDIFHELKLSIRLSESNKTSGNEKCNDSAGDHEKNLGHIIFTV